MNKLTGQRILLATVVVQAVLIIGLWFGPAAQQVHGDVASGTDASAQRDQMIQLLSSNNSKLDKIIDMLGSGNLQFQLAKPKDNSDSVK